MSSFIPVCVIGHCCHDTVKKKDGTLHQSLGGSPSFISAILTALQVPHHVVSVVGEDFKYSESITFRPRISNSHLTTAFEADFTGEDQIQRVTARCEEIRIEDLPDAEIGVGMVAGVVGEIPPTLISELRRRSKILIADVQGLIRNIDGQGWVSNTPIENSPYREVISYFDYLKLSFDEAHYVNLDQLRQITTPLVTFGSKGSTWYGSDHELHIPGDQVHEIDPTGAGDSFVAGFVTGLLRNLNPKELLTLANHCGAIAVQHVGVPRLTSPEFEALLSTLQKPHQLLNL